jgi:hypothetical protein
MCDRCRRVEQDHPEATLDATHYRAHIDWLAQEHHITVRPAPRTGPCADPLQRLAYIAAPTSDVFYATGLHELGHCISPTAYLHDVTILHRTRTHRGTVEDHEKVLAIEEEAWRWARETALVWTPAMELSKETALDGYRLAVLEAAVFQALEAA